MPPTIAILVPLKSLFLSFENIIVDRYVKRKKLELVVFSEVIHKMK